MLNVLDVTVLGQPEIAKNLRVRLRYLPVVSESAIAPNLL
jgi:hypothetical protein